MKRSRLRAKRPGTRRTVHPVQPAHRLIDGSVKRAEYRVGVDLRRLAKGQPCYAGFPGCSFDPAQTVLAHIRLGHCAGMGQKPADIIALPLDMHCHDILDRRKPCPEMTEFERSHELLRGLCQWLAWLWNNGYLHT